MAISTASRRTLATNADEKSGASGAGRLLSCSGEVGPDAPNNGTHARALCPDDPFGDGGVARIRSGRHGAGRSLSPSGRVRSPTRRATPWPRERSSRSGPALMSGPACQRRGRRSPTRVRAGLDATPAVLSRDDRPQDPHRASAAPCPAALARGSPSAGSASVGAGSGCLAFAGWEDPGCQDRSLSQWTSCGSGSAAGQSAALIEEGQPIGCPSQPKEEASRAPRRGAGPPAVRTRLRRAQAGSGAKRPASPAHLR